MSVTGPGNPLTLTGLTNGRTYRARVRARNFAGYGPYSEWSDPFTPVSSQIGPVSQVPEGWYRAPSIIGKVDNDPLAQWDDLSGNARHLLQATGSKQPLYKTAIQNGLAVVRFDGVDDFLQATFATPQPVQWFTVYMIRTGVHNAVDLSGASGGLPGYREAGTGGSVSAITTFGFEGIVAVAMGTTTFHVVSTTFDEASGDNTVMQLDGSAQAGPGNAGSNVGDPGGLTLGAYVDGGSNAAIDVGEHLVYKPPLSSTDSDTVRAYLKADWGTP